MKCGLGRNRALKVSYKLDDVGVRELEGGEAVVRAGGGCRD